MKYLLLTLALTACAPAVIQSQPPVVIVTPAPVVVTPPVAPAPVIVPTTLPTGPLSVLDVSQILTTLTGDVLRIELAPGITGVWLRITLPDGTPSAVTDNGACHCLGLGGNSAHGIAVVFLPGVLIGTSPSLDGPWTPAALTR